MGHGPEENYTELDLLAYKLYSNYMTHNEKVDEYGAEWWFVDNKEQYKIFYDQAQLQLRQKKIKKITNGL